MIFFRARSLFVLVSLALAASGCSREPEPQPTPQRPAGRPMAVPRDPDIAQVKELTQFKAAYEQAYRLGPDRRILLALSNLEHLLTGQPRTAVEARFQDGKWLLLSNGTELGSLPEFPDFTHAIALLEARARKLGLDKLNLSADKGEAAQLPLPLGRATLEELRRLDKDWSAGKRSASTLHQGARALAMLSFQLVDLTETADAVPARALAHLALARAATGEPLTEEQVLLAHSLGYSRTARQLAQALPPDSLLRLYVTEDDTALEARTRAERQPGLAQHLWLRRLAEVGRTERSERQSRVAPSSVLELQELSARLRINEFESDRLLGAVAPVLLLREVATAAGNPGPDERVRAKPSRKGGGELQKRVQQTIERFKALTRGTLPPFEEQLARVGQANAFFLDAEAERAWFQGLFFSAQYKMGLHLLDSLASAEAAQRFSSSLGTGSLPVSKDFQEWMTLLIDAESGKQAEASLMKSLVELESLGASPLVRVFEQLEDSADWGDPALSSMTRRLAARMDSRPDHRSTLASIAYSALLDIGLSEKLHRAALEAEASASVEAWLAWLDRGTTRLREMQRSPDVPARVRLRIIENLLTEQPEESSALMGKLAPLLKERGKEWSFTSRCVELLEDYQRYAEAQTLVERWLKEYAKPQSFDVVFARTALARLHQAQGNPQAGWTAVEPVIFSNQFGALQRAALLAHELGKTEQAEALAQQAAQRYPGHKSLALRAELLWRSGEHAQVPSLLAKPARALRAIDWRTHLGARFAAVFARRPVSEGLSAFEELRKAKVGALELSQLAMAVSRAGSPELAFEMQSRVDAPGLQKLEMIMTAYSFLKQWKSEQAAVEWLRAQVPPRFLEPLSMFAFSEKADVVLWDVIPGPQATSETADYVWLMRAAASLRARDSDEAHQQALHQRFEVDRPGFYHQVGRYLLGLIPEEAVIAAAATPKSRQELPFFLGFKAQVEGRYADAVTWYRAIVETSDPKVGEYRWAYNELYRLKRAQLSLARMKERKL
jgi:hypothetical protein